MTLMPYTEAWRERMTEKRTGTSLCGWCMGPPGARRPHHFGKVVANCPCGCARKPRPEAVVVKMLANGGVLTDPRIAEFMDSRPLSSLKGDRCGWCWRIGELTVTVSGDDQSPDLCASCTDAWDNGARKYVQKIRKQRGGTCVAPSATARGEGTYPAA